ncbi:MAG TPA: hypothetical protein VFX96_11945 [Pyrinomonadaceae bacterium]|nr:hypothetical protein [Pyrinomonadaceae bacterium]
MATEIITLEVDSETARAFDGVPASEWKKLEALFAVWLKEYARADGPSLKETMDEIGGKAQGRGLTPESLRAILEEE